MRTEQFENWLLDVRGLAENSAKARLSNARTLERYEGDLDVHFDEDRMGGLLARLAYSAEDERRGAQQLHQVPIRGNVRNGTATLKSAANLYREFREGDGAPERHAPNPARRRPRRTRTPAKSWPEWGQPKNEDILQLAKVLTPLARFLHPDIVAAVAEDNRQRFAEWRGKFEAIGVDPDIYMWRGSPCAFPGVRRYAGSHEIAWYRKRTASSDFRPPNCLRLDDNDFPKHLWAFVFTGKEFRKKGPQNYQLAHLADHKEHNNRWSQEFDLESETEVPLLFGLYTSPANTAYVPQNFLRPTDCVDTLRALLLRRAYRLYGGICRLAPPPLVEQEVQDSAWHTSQFAWREPVGQIDNLPQFLEYRHKVIDKALNERLAASEKPL